MEKYNLNQTGPEVQEILDSAATLADVNAEKERAEAAEQQNADDIDAIENKIPSGASSENKLATIDDVNNEADTRAGADAALRELIDKISALIPEAASALNQLADKQFVSEEIIEQIVAAIPDFAGQFTTLAQLQDVESPKAGDIGIVRTKDTDGHDVFTFYQYKDGQWNKFYSLSHHPQRKPASTGLVGDAPYNGMGRIELPMNWVEGWPNDTWLYYPYHDIVYLMYYWNGQMYAVYNAGTQEGLGLDDNLVVKPLDYNIADIQDFVGERYLPFTESSGVWTITKPDDSTITSTELNNTNIYKVNDPTHLGINVLTQAMINRPNTIYVIQHDYDLNGQTITVPENCVLEYDGGSLSNGTVHGNYCELIGDIKIPLSLDSDGNFKNRIWSFEHFGVPESPNRTENNNASDYIRHIIAFVPEGSVIKVGAKNYFVDKTIIVDKSISFESTGNHNYVTTNFYNWESSPITFFKIQAHCVSFKGIGFVGADTDGQHTSYPHTCIEIGDGLYPWDLITLIDCSIHRFNIGCIIKTNNVIIKGTSFSMSLYGVVFDEFTDSTYIYYKRNIQLLDGRFHDVKICTKFNSSWSAVMIKGFDVNHCCCLANNVNGNAIIIQGNIIFNPIEFEYNGDLYNYIINVVLGCNLSVIGNSVHIPGSDRLGFIKGNGIIIGNVIQNARLPIYIESISVISNNYLFKCGSKYNNVDYPVIEIVNSEYTIVMSNVLQNVSGEQNVLPSGIRMRNTACVCRDNAILNYTSPIEGKNAAGTSDVNYMKRLLNIQLNKGFDDLHWIPTMPEDGVGDGAMAINSLGLPIFAYKNTWITADGRNNTAKRDGNASNRPTGDKIYIGFMYFDDSLSPARPIFAAAINGTTVTWIDATGATV